MMPYPSAVPGQLPGGQIPTMPGNFPMAGVTPSGPGSVFGGGQFNPQLVELQRRAQELDNNNRQLTSQVAQIQQQATAYRERGDILARQLEDATRQNAQLLASAQQYANQARSIQASMNARGGAVLTANNSLANVANSLQIPGTQVVPDGNGLRMRIGADQLFAPGTVQLTPLAGTILDQFASNISRQYPQARIVVEGHTDASMPAVNAFQYSGAQAQAVMDYLIQRAGVPVQQISIVAQGANRPIANSQTPSGQTENRRVELVIAP
jgi:chemotaxis protein MotB